MTSLFSTQIVNGAAAKTALGGQALGSGASALLGGNGIGSADFWSIILGTGEEGKTKEAANSLLDNKSTDTKQGKAEKADLALLQLALLGQDADKSFEEKLGDLKIEQLAQTKENRVAQLTKLVEHLTSGLPQQDVGSGTLDTLVARLEKRLETLETSLDAFRNGTYENGEEPFKALIATGLNPAQLTNITSRIQEVEQKLGRELTVEDLIAGVGNIIPAPGDDDHEFAPTDALSLLAKTAREQNEVNGENQDAQRSEGLPAPTENANNNSKNNMADTAQKVASITDIIDQINAARIPAAGTLTGALEPTANTNTATGLVEGNIPEALSNAAYKAMFGEGKKAFPAIAKMNIGQNHAGNNGASNMAVNLTTPPAVEAALQFNFAAPTMDAALSDSLGYDISTGTPFTNAIQAAHMASNAPHAGQPHPATNMVAAQMTKSAQTGKAGEITLQLDPPELGRVEVRMEFLDDAKVKASLVVEKPETLLMLQRDAQALEKALQNAGLETDSNSLSFEMASDEHAFNSNKDGQGNEGERYGANNGNGEDGEDDLLIQTNMTWDVDPETGHVHYNILA